MLGNISLNIGYSIFSSFIKEFKLHKFLWVSSCLICSFSLLFIYYFSEKTILQNIFVILKSYILLII